MSKQVDNRVVEMRFDNSQFESNVKTSMSTLERLKQSLNFKGASKSLDGISSSVKSVNMNPLAQGVEAVQMKFSALQIAATTVLANITNSAVNAGKRLVSAFTIEPVKTGLAEYETQINAVQTILANTASKGTNLEQVNAALDELNHYADMTIYNFTEMTRNIGTFTAAGIDLDTSVNAIQGIANLAAVSGSTSQQASTAMYQLSQALATGTVKLMDWNSVVNAGMGGELFQNALRKTSEELNTGAEAAIKAEGSFRDSLQTGWLTSEVLTETLKKFTTSGANEYVAEYCGISADAVQSALDAAEAQYGEADAIDKAAEALANKTGKNKDEIASALQFAKTAEDAATKVKTFSQLIDTLKEAAQSGWTQTWEILIGDFEEAKALWTEASDYFGNAINAMSDARNQMLQAWADAGGRTMAFEAIKNAFSGLLNIITPIKDAFRDIFPAMTADRLFKITEKVRDLTANFKEFTERIAPKIQSTFKGIFAVIDIGVTFITKLVGGILKLIGNFTGLGEGILGVTGSIGDWLSNLRDTIKETDIFGTVIDGVVGFLQKGIDKFKEFKDAINAKIDVSPFEKIKEVFSSIFDFVKKLGSGIFKSFADVFDFDTIFAGLSVLNAGILTTALLGIKKFFKGLSSSFADLPGLMDGIKDILDGVRGSLEAWQNNLKAGTLQKIAIAIAILAASLLVLSTIKPEKLVTALAGITVLFMELSAAMVVLSKIDSSGFSMMKISTAMIAMAAAVLILAGAVKMLSGLSWSELAKGLVGTVVLLGAAVGAALLLSNYGGKIQKGALQIVILAAAVKILASACMDLSGLSWEELAKGLVGVGILLAAIAIFINNTEFSGRAMTTAIGIVLVAAAIKILASAAGDFAGMEWGEIAKGLVAIGALLTELALFVNLTGDASKVIATGTALVLIAASMKIFASAMTDFASMSWTEIAKGLVAMGGALLEIGIAMNFMPKDMLLTGAGLVVVAAALNILANSLGKMGGMSWTEIGKGLAALGGSMLILAIGLNAMNGTLAGSAALIIAAAAIALLTPALKSLGEMTWGEIIKSLIAIAGAFAVIGVAGLLLAPVTPIILLLSAAMLLFGIACVAVGAGIVLVATGLTMLAAVVPAHVASIIATLTMLAEGLGGIITAICNSIVQAAPALGEAIKTVVLTLVDVIITCAPAIVEGVLVLITQVLQSLVAHGPEIAELLFQLFSQAITFLTAKAGELVDLLVNFIVSIIQAIAGRIGDIISAVVELVSAIVQGAVDAIGPIIEGVIAPIVDLIVNALSGLLDALSPIIDLISGAISSICNVFVTLIQSISPIIDSITSLIQQLGESIATVFQSIADVISTCGQTICDILSSVGEVIGTVFSGIAEVIRSVGDSIRSVLDGIADVISAIGESALNAGKGFEHLADGVKTITELNLLDMAASMTAVATGIGKITSHSSELAEAGEGMKNIADGTKMSADAFNSISAGVAKIVTDITAIGPAATTAMGTLVSSTTSAAISFTSISSAASAAVRNINTSFSSLRSVSGTVSSALTSAMSAAVSSVSRAGTSISSAMSSAMRSLISAVNSSRASIVSAFTSLCTSMISAITSRISTFQAAGTQMINAFTNAIRSGSSAVSSAVKQMMSSCESALKSGRSNFYNAGSYLVEGFCSGISSNAFKAAIAAKAMAVAAVRAAEKALGEQSPSKVFKKIGAYAVEGFKMGIDKNVGQSNEASASMAKGVLKSFQNVLKINSPSLVMNEQGHYIVQGVAEGIEDDMSAEEAAAKKAENIVEAFRTELEKNDNKINLADALLELDESKYPNASAEETYERNKTNLEQKLEEYKRDLAIAQREYDFTVETLGEQADASIEARIKLVQAEKLVYDTQRELDQALLDYNDDQISRIEDQIDKIEAEKKVYESMISDDDELTGVILDQQTYNKELPLLLEKVKIAEQKKTNALEKFGESSQEYHEATIAFANAQVEYNEMLANLSSLTSQYSGVHIKSVSSATLQQEKYNQAIADTNRLLAEGLITQKQADQYILEHKPVLSQALEEDAKATGETAINSLTDSMIVSADQSSILLRKEGAIMAASFNEGFTGTLSECEDTSLNIIRSSEEPVKESAPTWKEMGTQLVDTFANGIRDGKYGVLDAIQDIISAALSKLQNGITSGSKGTSSVSYTNKTSSGGSNPNNVDSSVIEAMKKGYDETYGTSYSTGASMSQGLSEGAKSGLKAIVNVGVAIGRALIGSVKTTTKTNSPSKVFMEIGGYLVDGLVLGIRNATETAVESAKLLAERVSEAATNDADIQPHITPVLDLGRVNSTNARLTTNLTASLTAPVESWSKRINDAQAEINSSNERVIKAVNGLREDINTAANSYEKETNLYVDSKKLASSIVRPMNRELNILSKRGAY